MSYLKRYHVLTGSISLSNQNLGVPTIYEVETCIGTSGITESYVNLTADN